MPTASPRLLVTVSSHQHQLLRQLSRYQGRSMASYLSLLLDYATPALERLEQAYHEIDEIEADQLDLESYLSELVETEDGATAPASVSSAPANDRGEAR